MEYRRLGSSGLKVSALSLGAWVTYGGQVGVEAARACMHAALEHGVNFFDNAEAYAQGQAETVMGQVIKGMRREDLVISSKVFWGGDGPNDRGLSRKHIIEGCHNSLKRLGLDYLDLFFCHRPDFNTPVEETVRALDDLVHQGKILYWGTSEWPAERIMAAYGVARQINGSPPQMEQPQYNMFVRDRFEKEYARLYSEIGLGTTIWSPLASGLLSGKYNQGIPDDSRAALKGYEWIQSHVITPARLDKVRQLQPLAAELGCSLAQMALAWCLKNPNVSTVITGASRPEQVHENMLALDVAPKLTVEVMTRIEAILQNKPGAEED